MIETLHVIRKDATHLRWALLAWAVVVVAHLAVNLTLASTDVRGFAFAIVARQLSSLTSLVELLMLCLMVSWIVHEDSPVNREAFWLTRPFDPRQLTAAKLALAGAALVLLPFLGELAAMAFFQVSARDMWRAAPPILLDQAAWVLALTAAAAVTPSLTRYAVVIVAAAASIVLLISATVASLLLFTDLSQSRPPRPEVGDPTPTVIATILVIGTSLWVAIYQYRRRQVKTAATVGIAGLFAAAAVSVLWPWHPNPLPDPDPGAWSRDTVRSAAIFNAGTTQVADAPSFRRQDAERKQVSASVVLAGMPDDMFVYGTEVTSQFDVGGVVLRSHQSDTSTVARDNTYGMHTRLSSQRAALGSARLPESEADRWATWPALLNVSDEEFARYGRAPGRLTATIDFYLNRSVVAAAIPLTVGGIVRDDTRRMEIVRIEQRSDGCTVTIREITIVPLLWRRSFNSEEFLLRNTQRAQAARGDQESTEVGSSSVLPLFVGLALGGDMFGAAGPDGRAFGVRTLSYRYPNRRAAAALNPTIDAAWLASAELVWLRSEYAGHVARSLTIDNFRMSEQ